MTIHRSAFVPAVLLCAMIPSPAHAQNALGDGRALDANLRQGSGGINEPGVDPRLIYNAYQDALITGNVPGLARFRGDIDYRAPGEFTDRLSSDDTYAQRLNFLPQQPINDFQRRQLGQDTSPYASPFRQESIVLRGGRGVTVGDVTRASPASGAQSALAVNAIRDDVNTFTATGPSNNQTLDSTLLDVRPRTIGMTRDAAGAVSRLEASPLVGLRIVPLEQGPRFDLPPRPGQEPAPATPTATTPGAPRGPGEAEAPGQTGNRVDDRTPTADPARPIDDRVTGQRVTGDAPRSDLPPGLTSNWRDAKPGQDVYVDLLRKMGRLPAPDEAVVPEAPNRNVPTAPQTQPTDDAQPVDPQAAVKQEQQRKRDREKDAAERQALVRMLAEQIALAEPSTTTLVGSGDTLFDRHLAKAERFMREGEYFRAEGEYVQALRERPGHPMAMVGRIHAQIGSGLHLSASTNLRELFTAHPELIATRYGQPLIPTDERLTTISRRLAGSLAASDRAEIPLLVAYVAYQQKDAALMNQALDVASERSRDDALLDLLRQVWAGQAAGTKPDAGAKTAPDAPGGAASE